MRIRHVKGNGLYATHTVELPEFSQGWHIKARPSNESASLREEVLRTRWARQELPVSEHAVYLRLPGVGLLITKTIEGIPSFKFVDILSPQTIINSIFKAVEVLRGAQIEDFPYQAPHWTQEQAILQGLQKVAHSRERHKALHPDFAQRSVGELRDIAERGPGKYERKLSHGDLCMPNVLLDANGSFAGFVDLGALHVGDARLDIAILSWSAEAIMSSKWSTNLLSRHGMEADDQGVLYNRLIYDLSLDRPDPWAWTQSQKLIEQRARLSAE